ncbi:hypothetical protein [Neorhodopirellula pilleata]|uniref:hypothetical protein n=1 Tax=Neorhodopirellula pilleata TaxID=2714738 RepID=UPI0011B5C870|nr:hypothetical protein [Neorhodopirellula pilleata]
MNDPIQEDMNVGTQTLPPPTATSSPVSSGELLTPTRSALETFADRRARLLSVRGMAIGFVVFVVGVLLLVVADRFIRVETVWRVVASLVVDAIAVIAAWRFGIRESRQRDWTAIAQRMETATPALHEQMLSAVELGDASPTNGSAEFRGALQTQVADQVSRLEVARMLPWGLIRNWTIAVIGLASLVGLLSLVPSLQLPRRLARVIVPIAPIERASVTQIEIVRPTPPSRSVAEGDLVAVAVTVSRLGSGNVRLQRQGEDGLNEMLFMSPRDFMPSDPNSGPAVSSEASDSDGAQTFAVNVQVHQTPVRYRVLAGDAETLWHTLTPQPRPRMVSFEKLYEFPRYSRLAERNTVDEFGDLVGIVGTNANVIVTFDQPVEQVELLFGNGQNDLRIPVQSVDDSRLRFQYQIPIKTPGSYRVDAVSTNSGLNNPFSPRFSIDPVIDRAPVADWNSGTANRQIVSPAAVIDLAGTIQDDLPMDQFAQQFVLDDGEVIERPLPIQEHSTDNNRNGADKSVASDEMIDDRSSYQVTLRWDMMNHDANGPAAMLSPGSQLKTRLIAIDRAGNRGASEWIHVFIAGSDFDESRHDELRQFQTFSRRVKNWFDDFAGFVDLLKDATKDAKNQSKEPPPVDPDWTLTLTGLESSWAELSGIQISSQKAAGIADPAEGLTIADYVAKSNDSVAAERWILMDRYATQAMTDMAMAIQTWDEMGSSQPPLSKRSEQQLAGEIASLVSRAEKPMKQIVEFAQWNLSVELAAGLMRDLQMIQSDAEVLADENATVPIDRLPGQADLMIERLRQVGELASSMQADLPSNTVKHQERLHRYLVELSARIEQENDKLKFEQNPDVEVNFRRAMKRIVEELGYHLTTSLLQGDTFNQIASTVRELNRSDWMLFQEIERLREIQRNWDRARELSEKALQQQDTSEITDAAAEQSIRRLRRNEKSTAVIDGYQRSETIQRQRRDSNVQEVSDFKLIGRVVQAVTNEDFTPPESMTVDNVLASVRRAASILEAGNQTVRLKGQLQDLADRERYGNDLADGAIRQGLRLEHYQVVSETPLQLLRDGGVDAKAMESLQATRWDNDFQQARQWTTSRRYDPKPFLSATTPVQSMVDRYQVHLSTIEAAMADARSKLRQYLPTTGELARDAAEEAEQQSEKNQEPDKQTPDKQTPDKQEPDKQKSQEQLDSQQDANQDDEAAIETLQEKVDALAEDLADRADTADYTDEAQRELARDADAALETLKEQMKAVVAEAKADAEPDSPDPRDAPTALEELAETLRTTAEHFDAADAGKDISQTRQALREASPLSELQSAAQAANATARAADSTPEELLERLEQRLDGDQIMQGELAEISQQTAAAVEQAVRSAAKQEKSLQQELEKADPEFLEKKRALRDQLKSLTDQSRAVDDQWLSMAESVSGWNQDQPAREKLRQSREQLRAAVDQAEQVQNDQALLKDLQEANKQLQQSIDEAVRNVSEVEKNSDAKANDNVHENEKSRQQKARQLESAQRETQNRWLQSLSRQEKDWQQRRDEAGKRVQSAQNQQRSAEKQLEQAQQQLQKHPNEEWAQKGVQESRERVEEAIRAGDQAKQTRQAAEQAEKEASQRLSDSRRSTVQDLQAKNPSAELLARVAKKSTDELARIAQDLKAMQDQNELAKTLLPSPAAARRLAEQQSQTNQTVRQAAEDLQRAARHEERLGNEAVAEQLDQAASELQATLNESMLPAEHSLAQSGQSSPNQNEPDRAKPEADSESQRSQSAQRAGGQLGQAAQRLETQADQISQIESLLAAANEMAARQAAANQADPNQADASQDDRNGAAPADPSPMKEVSTGTLGEASRSEKLARTLDELDRGIHQSAAADQSVAQSQSSQASDQSSTQSQSQSQSQTKPSTAGEASPTLAASAEQAIRELAAQRQKQVQQIASATQAGDPSSAQSDSAGQADPNSNSDTGTPSEGQPGQPGTVSGDGSQMPDGGLIDARGQLRVDGQWGNLREQKNNDVIQDRKTSLPMSYRPAIEAYFQAISAEAARSRSKESSP